MDDHNGLQWAHAAWTGRIPSFQWLRPRRIVRVRDFFLHRPPGYWPKWANRALSLLVSALLVVAIGRQLARITWTLIPGAPLEAPLPRVNSNTLLGSTELPAVDIQAIVDAHLFGEFVEHVAQPVAPIVEAPETELNLLLRATVSEVREGRLGAAIIASDGAERTYAVGEEIEGTGGALVQAIHVDRIILNLAGELQTLRLPSSDTALDALTIAPVTSAAIRPAPTRQAASAPVEDTTLSASASRLIGTVSAAPHVAQGRMVGFRLQPRDDPVLFQSLGFEPGDVVTEINGAALTDPGQAAEVFERLGESAQANVTLLRNGRLQVLSIDTTQEEAPAGTP